MNRHYLTSALIAGLWARWDASSRDAHWRGVDIPVTLGNGLTFTRRHVLTRADVRDLAAYIEAEHSMCPDAPPLPV